MEWAAENIRKANIGVKVVYEWVDEPTADLTEVGLALSEREDIQSVIGCNVADNTQKLAFALARKKENIKPLFTFSTSQELPRIFGHRGFLWGLCETDMIATKVIHSEHVMHSLFDDMQAIEREQKLTSAMDAINETLGKGTIKLAVQGSGNIKMASKNQSPHYTTLWTDIPTVKVE